jgi:hypothetical protein
MPSNEDYPHIGDLPRSARDLGQWLPSTTVTTEVRLTDPETGGQKGSKPERYDLIPWSPAMDEVARVYAFGAEKYADHNWRKGYPWSWSLASLFRHVKAFASGEDRDPESGLHHLAHAVFHCLSLITFGDEHPDKDDRWSPPAS